MNVLLVAAGVAIAVTFLVAALLALPHRPRPGVAPFVVLCFLLSTVPVPMALIGAGLLGPARQIFVVFVFVWLSWFVLALEYTGRGPTMTPSRVGVLVAYGFATSLGVLVAPFVPERFIPLLFQLNTALQLVLFTVLAYGIFLVARAGVSYAELDRGEALLLATAGGGLGVVGLLRILTPAVPVAPMQLPQLAILACIAGLLVLVQVRSDVFESGTGGGHLARETVFDNMRQAAFVVDPGGWVLDCNRTASRLFGPERDRLLGRPVDEVVGTDISFRDGQEATTLRLNTMHGRRRFELTTSPLTTEGGTRIGGACVLRDVTDHQTHEQRVEVLNRVLRHNLRNDLDAVRGFAETIGHHWDDEGVDSVALAGRIEEIAQEMAALGELAGETERLLSRDALERERVDVAGLAGELVSTYRDRYPNATISLDTSGASLSTDERLLAALLDEVLENALEHNDVDDPKVSLRVEPAEGGVRVAVSDDGPGIPARERDVLLSGEETPLRHGSGLGLWLVHWGTTRLGGDLELDANTPRGSVVSLTVPDFDRARPGSVGAPD